MTAIILTDESSYERVQYPLDDFINHYDIVTLDDYKHINLDCDIKDFKPPSQVWNGEDGEVNTLLKNIILGRHNLKDSLIKLYTVYRGFIGGTLQINDHGSYKKVDSTNVNLLSGYMTRTNPKMMLALTTLSSTVVRALNVTTREDVLSAQGRYLTACSYPEGRLVEINHHNYLETDLNMNLLVSADMFAEYIDNMDLFNIYSQNVSSSQMRNDSLTKTLLIIYSLLFGKLDHTGRIGGFDGEYVSTLPHHCYIKNNEDIILEVLRNGYPVRAYFTAELFACISGFSKKMTLQRKNNVLGGTIKRALSTRREVNNVSLIQTSSTDL